MSRNRLTKGRLRPFPQCQHQGWGVACHRCEQAEELETRANELALCIKTGNVPTLPLLEGDPLFKYLTITGDSISVRGGGRSFKSEITGKLTHRAVIAELVHKMRDYSNHLHPTKTLVSSATSASN